MGDDKLKEVMEQEFNRALEAGREIGRGEGYGQGYVEGFIAGAIEAKKQMIAKEISDEHRTTEFLA